MEKYLAVDPAQGEEHFTLRETTKILDHAFSSLGFREDSRVEIRYSPSTMADRLLVTGERRDV